jgi:hypothetical protein
MIEHLPWIGGAYSPDRLMLWGFSHHMWSDETDATSFTTSTIEEYALTDRARFFRALRTACGGSDPVGFWNGVAFANTLPNAVVDDYYSPGSREARQAVRSRVRRILEWHQPRKTILFSRKGWTLWPEFNGSYAETHPARVLATSPIKRTEWGSYKTGAPWETLAYNLPHPQYTPIDDLRAAVTAILAHEAVP